MDRATRQALRSFPSAMWIVAGGNFVNRFGGFVVPMLALHLTRLGCTETQAGSVLGVYGVGKLFASIAGGTWTDRFGHRTVIACSMFGSAAVTLGMATLVDYHAILGATLVLGFVSELFRPATSALIADLAAPENRITAFALNRLAINAGFAFGPALGGLIAEHSFVWVFVGNAIADLTYGLIAWFGVPAHPRLAGGSAADAPPPSWAEVLRDRRLLLYLGAVFPITFVFMQSVSSYALYTQSVGLSSREYGLLLSVNGALIVCGELSLTGVTRRFRPDRVLMLGYLLLGGGFALSGLLHSFWMLAGSAVIWTLGEMISAPPQGAVLANLAPDRLRGRYMGAYSLMWSAGVIVGPWLGTVLYAWRPAVLWWTCAGVGVASAWLVRLALRVPAQSPAKTPV
jgi:MFS family permease